MYNKVRITVAVIVSYIAGWIAGQYWHTCPKCSTYSPVPRCVSQCEDTCPPCTACPKNEHQNIDAAVVQSPEANFTCGNLIESLRRRGSYIHNALEINETQGPASHGRGVFAMSAIDRDTVLFAIPDALALVARNVWEHAGLASGVTLEPGSLRTLYLRDDDAASVYCVVCVCCVVLCV